jgi:DNA repair protein SbcD/Mre11
MPKILHFADAHIDMANYGRHDPYSGLPLRVMDFLKSLDTIVDTAIEEKVDLVLFAGDAYKDRNPAPTYQREWGKRIMRLSKAGIPTVLLVGNHDLSPSFGRAHAVEEFSTLEVPHVFVIDRPTFLQPSDLEGVALQIMALPWISRSGLLANLGIHPDDPSKIYSQIEASIIELVNMWLEKADPSLPVVLTAHASVQGAVYGAERSVMLGGDLVLPGSLLRDTRLDYVALGHIHKPQNLNENAHPPVIYPGSIERVDFGEAKDQKFFIIAHVNRGVTQVEWRQLKEVRPFVDLYLRLKSQVDITNQLDKILPDSNQLENAVVRLVLEYPRDWESLIDESRLRQRASSAFEFHLVKRPRIETRIRLPEDQAIGSLTHLELLERYWLATHADTDNIQELTTLAKNIIEDEREQPND